MEDEWQSNGILMLLKTYYLHEKDMEEPILVPVNYLNPNEI
jgi:hypothetical protein